MRASRPTATRIQSFKSIGEDSRQSILAQMPAEGLGTPNRGSQAEEESIRWGGRGEGEHCLGMCQQVQNDLKEALATNNNGTERSTEEA